MSQKSDGFALIRQNKRFGSDNGMGFDRIISRFLPAKTWKKHYYKKKISRLRKSELGDSLLNNVRFKGIYKGKRCFVLGNGPSLSKVDLALLKDEITFSVNDLYYKEDFEKLNTTYHILCDPYYFKEANEIIQKVCQKSKPQAIFVEGSGYAAFAKINPVHYPVFFFSNGVEIDDLSITGINLCKMLPYFCTVVQSAISIAIYMGFDEIYLLGCDCTGILNYIDRVQQSEMKQYAYQLPESEMAKQQEVMINDEHMFFEWYHIFKSYRLLNEYMKKNKIKFINLTENGILDSIEKGNLKDVIQSK